MLFNAVLDLLIAHEIFLLVQKNDTLTKRTKTICDKMNRTAKANSAYNKDLGFAPQEAELLSLEAQSSCLTSSHNSKAKSIQERIPTTMKVNCVMFNM